MPAIDVRSLCRLVLVALVAIRIDTRLGLLLISCFVVRRVTADSETFVAKVVGPLATTWLIALSILLAIDGTVSVWLAVTSNAGAALDILSAFELTILALSSKLHLLRLNWGANTAALATLMIVAIYLPQWTPVARFAATMKAIGRVSGVVAVLASFTFFGATATLPKHVEAIVDESARTEREKIQATLGKSARQEFDSWQRSFAFSVVKQALEDSTTAPRLIEWTGEIGKIPSQSRQSVAELLVDTRVPEMSRSQEQDITDLLTKRLSEIPKPGEIGLDVPARGGTSSHGNHPWLETYDRARQLWPYRSTAPSAPMFLSIDPTGRVREQKKREGDAVAAAQELENGFKALIAKTVDGPRRQLFDHGIAAVIDALAASGSPFAQDIAKAVAENIGREAVSKAVKSHVDRIVVALRMRHWSPSAQPPTGSVERVVAQHRILRIRTVVGLTLDAYRASRDAGAAQDYSEARRKADEAEKFADLAELEASRIERVSFGLDPLSLDPLSRARDISVRVKRQAPLIRQQAAKRAAKARGK